MPWHCSACGEEVIEKFQICWNCGTDREGNSDPGFEQEQLYEPGPPEAETSQFTMTALLKYVTWLSLIFAVGRALLLWLPGLLVVAVGISLFGILYGLQVAGWLLAVEFSRSKCREGAALKSAENARQP